MTKKNTDSIILGGGCFWCLEAAFRCLPGVLDVTSGYAGGDIDNPTYEAVCQGKTGHAEVIKIDFDMRNLKLREILDLFFEIHDPTTRNRQGADVGSQYRSVIFTREDQTEVVEKYIESKLGTYSKPIVTEVAKLDRFWPAEDYHQRYFEKNPKQGYCQTVVAPKVVKAREYVNGRE